MFLEWPRVWSRGVGVSWENTGASDIGFDFQRLSWPAGWFRRLFNFSNPLCPPPRDAFLPDATTSWVMRNKWGHGTKMLSIDMSHVVHPPGSLRQENHLFRARLNFTMSSRPAGQHNGSLSQEQEGEGSKRSKMVKRKPSTILFLIVSFEYLRL